MRQRLIPLLAVALASTALTACGSKEAVVTHAETEAEYVAVGPAGGPYLKYQVQVSRMINPGDFQNPASRGDAAKVDPEDSEYLRGLPASELALKKNPQKPLEDEIYFGVFIQAANDTKKPLQSAAVAGFEIHDSQYVEGQAGSEDHVYEPLTSADATNPPNPFLYRQATVPAATGTGSGIQPLPNSPAGSSTTAAELLIFKIPMANLENRPLTLEITGPTGGKAEIDLDV
jgi:hypothetical protein